MYTIHSLQAKRKLPYERVAPLRGAAEQPKI